MPGKDKHDTIVHSKVLVINILKELDTRYKKSKDHMHENNIILYDKNDELIRVGKWDVEKDNQEDD